MQIVNNIIFPIFFASGFYCIGLFLIKIFKLIKIVEKISNPIYQYCSFGIVSFLFIFYPIFFFNVFNSDLIKYIAFTILILGIINLLYFSSQLINYFKIFLKKKELIYKNHIHLIFVVLYFFLSLAPMTSGDSVAYHSVVSKHIFLFGEFPKNSFELASALAGAGEFLNAFAISINATTFTSFIHFIGLISILGVFDKSLTTNNIQLKDKHFFFLLFLSCPVLIFLIYSSKPQFFYISLIFFCFSSLVNIEKFKSQIEVSKIYIISIIFGIIAILAKFSFVISFFLIILNYLILIKNISNFYKTFLISLILLLYLMLPSLLWKQELYHYPFFQFLFNPLPINIPGFYEHYVQGKNYGGEGFPLSLFIPLSFSTLNIFLGFGCLIVFFLLKEKFTNKKIFIFSIFFFIFFLTYFGQKSPRFYLEIYLFSVLLFISIFYNVAKYKFYKLFRSIIYIQSIFTLILLFYGVTIFFPGSLSENLNKKILSKYANGYDLYNWINHVLPSGSKIITNHRSAYFSLNNTLFLDFTFHINFDDASKKDYWLFRLKEQKPDFILFYGAENIYNYSSFNFKNCLNLLYVSKNNVGFHATRNPFNKGSENYNAYIYKFDYNKLPYCVTKN
jgi:hypothetical protein